MDEVTGGITPQLRRSVLLLRLTRRDLTGSVLTWTLEGWGPS